MSRIYQKRRKASRVFEEPPVRTGRHAPIAPEIREAVRLLYAGRTLTNVEIGMSKKNALKNRQNRISRDSRGP